MCPPLEAKKLKQFENYVTMVHLLGLTQGEALRACNYPCSRQNLSYRLNEIRGHAVIMNSTPSETNEISSLSTSYNPSPTPVSFTTTNDLSPGSNCKKSSRRKLVLSKSKLKGNSLAPIKDSDERVIEIVDSEEIHVLDSDEGVIEIGSDSEVFDIGSGSNDGAKEDKKVNRRRPSSLVSKLHAQKIIEKKNLELEYNKALVEATARYKNKNRSKVGDSIRKICADVNEKYLQNFTKKLTRTSLTRYDRKGDVSLVKRGPPPKVSETFLQTMALHVSMKQVSGLGEAKP